MTAPDVCVLIADDELMIVTIMGRIITSMGLTAITVADGARAIETASALQSCLVCAILDVAMPGTDGVAAAEAIRQSFPELPIILMSGSIPSALIQRSTQIPHVAFLQKPFTIREVKSILTPLLPIMLPR
jgi:CheY-like chemotaxis protein